MGEGAGLTLQQGLSFALVGATVLCFVWGRWRYDLIAVGALAVGNGSLTLGGLVAR